MATAFQPNAFQTNAFQIDGGSFGDGALNATGTGTATFLAVGQTSLVASATGTGTALFVGASTSDQRLAATGTGTALFVGASDAASLFNATGTGTATLLGAPFVDGRLNATGTVTATFAGDYDAYNCALLLNDDTSFLLKNDGGAFLLNDDSCLIQPLAFSDADLSVSGSGVATLVGASEADGVLTATGTGDATFAGASDALSALTVTGTVTVSFVADAFGCGLVLNDDASYVLLNAGGVLLLNDNTCLIEAGVSEGVLSVLGTGDAAFVGDFEVVVQPEPEQPVVEAGGGGAFPGAWRLKKKKKKKDELDDLIAQLRERIVPWREAQEVGAQIMLRAELEQALTVSLDDSLDRIEAEIANLTEVLAEIDDEEALLLLM